MTIEEVMAYYKTAHYMEKRHGLSHQNLQNWKKIGYIPITTQLKIEQKTGGELVADLNHCNHRINK